jgi:hypothetical protein
MRSSEDEPKAAFATKEEAQQWLDDHTEVHVDVNGYKSTSYCGGYSWVIKEVPFYDPAPNDRFIIKSGHLVLTRDNTWTDLKERARTFPTRDGAELHLRHLPNDGIWGRSIVKMVGNNEEPHD